MMRGKIRRWRHRQPSRILFIAVPEYGTTLVAAGRRSSQRLRLIEVHRP